MGKMRLIDAADVENFVNEHIFDANERYLILDFLRNCSTVDVVEVNYGHWTGGYYQQNGDWFYKKPICSECGHEHDGVTNYCENCGAKMVANPCVTNQI